MEGSADMVEYQAFDPRLESCGADLPGVGGEDAVEPEMDWEHLQQLADGNEEFQWELLQLFVDDSWEHFKELERAIAEQNFTGIERAAHHLKGASANVGAISIQTITADLELQAQQHQLQGIEGLLPELAKALEHLQGFIKANCTLP